MQRSLFDRFGLALTQTVSLLLAMSEINTLETVRVNVSEHDYKLNSCFDSVKTCTRNGRE
jgi:hypothetical protein